MIETVFELIRHGFSLVFGVAVSVLFAGIKTTRKNTIVICFICVVFLLAQFACQLLFGLDIMIKLYPLLIHLPLIIILTLYYKRPLLISIVSVLSAYLCLQAPKWIEMLSRISFNNRLAEIISYIAAVFIFYHFLKRYVAVSVQRLMEKSKKICVFFGVMPLFFYLFNYITIIYTDLLYSNTEIAVEFIPSFISVFYFVFIILYNAEIQKQANLQREHELAKEIIASGRGYYEHLTDITEQMHILRHDYKYHLLSMQKLFEDGYADEAREYLAVLNINTNEAPLYNYCKNRVLNALLSGFAERCEKEQISFTVKIELLPSISDYEMCIISGNLLDNAVTACKKTPEGKKRYIELRMRRHDDYFGFMTENSFDGGVNQNGDKLVSAKKDGGFGINSIISIISRHNGEYTPVWDEEKFKAFVIIKN